jgi:prepilin-type N-terminal cleavage/methylation domain-containing protein
MTRDRIRDQSGMTLVELLVAVTVASIVLAGAGSVLYIAYHASNEWSGKLDEAQSLNQLSGWLQQDTHRYVPCGQADSTTLSLCLPSAPGQPIVTYTTTGTRPYDLARTDATSGQAIVVGRRLNAAPIFDTDCVLDPTGNVVTGHLAVTGLSYVLPNSSSAPSRSNLSLYFRAPTNGRTPSACQ